VAVLPDEEAERMLAVVAHSDDAESWLGAAIARCTDAGIKLAYCVVTGGSGGDFDPEIPRAEISRIRRAEQQQAAALLGVSELRFLGISEQELADQRHRLHEELVRVDWAAIARDLKPIYTAASEAEALERC
jgi:LmbE family N-acetylglucosaminyl deacetylase